MQLRLYQMQARVYQMEEIQQEKALIPIVFQMRKYAKNMQFERQDRIKGLMANKISLMFKQLKEEKNKNKPRR